MGITTHRAFPNQTENPTKGLFLLIPCGPALTSLQDEGGHVTLTAVELRVAPQQAVKVLPAQR